VAVVHGAEHEVAFVDDQVRVLEPFARTEAGFAVRLAVTTTGAVVTVTVA
jgi:hypothetical protein